MRLTILKDKIKEFRHYFESEASYEYLWLYEGQKARVARKEIDSYSEYMVECMSGATHTRLWKQPQYEPKRMLVLLAQFDIDFVESCFSELFDEKINIDIRLDRFIFYFDDLLQRYRKANPVSIENNHYQDYRILSLYLTFFFPDKYAYYDPQAFEYLMNVLGMKYVPNARDPQRFFKVCGIIEKFLKDDDEIESLQNKRPGVSGGVYASRFIVSEFVWYVYNQR